MPHDKQLKEQLRSIARRIGSEPVQVEDANAVEGAADTIERLEAERDKQARVTKEELRYASEKRRSAEGEYAEARAKLVTLEAERERDAAVLEGLTSNEAIQAATREWGQCNVDAGVKYPIPQRLKLAISAALQHAQEQVGEDRG